MVPDSSLPRPTDAELVILRVLWKSSPLTVREVWSELNQQRSEPLAYTTVLRFLQIMTEKGLVLRDGDERGHRYRPTAPEERTKKQLVGDLLERAFGGSTHDLVVQALGSGKISPEEMKEIRRLIDEL